MTAYCRFLMARRCACASSGNSATRWRSTSCASKRSRASPGSPADAVVIGKIAATSGTREFDPRGRTALRISRLRPDPLATHGESGAALVAYTIEHLAAPTLSGTRAVKTAAMVFHDEAAEIEGAYVLLKSGIAVTKVAGPGVQIGP